jgi:hypothetical protein
MILCAEGGKFYFGVEEGGYGISRGLCSVGELLQFLPGLHLVVRNNVALTNHR